MWLISVVWSLAIEDGWFIEEVDALFLGEGAGAGEGAIIICGARGSGEGG